jgi:hypothetical protein
MSHILFLNKGWGVDFMLMRRLEKEKIEYLHVAMDSDEDGLYKKYNVRSTPCLLVLDNDKVVDTLKSTDEIVEYLKNEQNTET